MDTRKPDAGPSFARILRVGWWIITLSALVGLGLGVMYAASQPTVYSSKVALQVKPITRDALSSSGSSSNSISLDTESQVIESDDVLKAASAAMQTHPLVTKLRKDVTITAVPGSTVLEISCKQDTAVGAQNCATTLAKTYLAARADSYVVINQKQLDSLTTQKATADHALTTVINQEQAAGISDTQRAILENQRQQLTSEAKALQASIDQANRFVADAGVVTKQASVGVKAGISPMILAFGGLVVGAVVGLVLASLRAQFDKLVRSSSDVEKALEAPVLAIIPGDGAKEPATSTAPDGKRATAYHRLSNGVLGTAERQHRLTHAGPVGGHVIAVVSAGTNGPALGAAVTANLATLFAGRNRPVSVLQMSGSTLAADLLGLDVTSRPSSIKVVNPTSGTAMETIIALEVESGRTVLIELGAAEQPSVQGQASAAEVVVLACGAKGVTKAALAEIRDGLAGVGIRSLTAVVFEGGAVPARTAARVAAEPDRSRVE